MSQTAQALVRVGLSFACLLVVLSNAPNEVRWLATGLCVALTILPGTGLFRRR